MIVHSKNGEKYIMYMLGETFDELKSQVIQLGLENNDFNITQTARALKISRATLHKYAKSKDDEPS